MIRVGMHSLVIGMCVRRECSSEDERGSPLGPPQSAEVCTARRGAVLEVERAAGSLGPRTLYAAARARVRDYVCIAALRAERAAARERSFQKIILRFPIPCIRSANKRKNNKGVMKGVRTSHHTSRRSKFEISILYTL